VTPHQIITNHEYLASFCFAASDQVSACRTITRYRPQFYASLLAGRAVTRSIPTVETMIDHRRSAAYEHALELELARQCRQDLGASALPKACIFFGIRPSNLDRFAKLLFDWFRAGTGGSHRGQRRMGLDPKIGFHPLARMTDEEETLFIQCLRPTPAAVA
jgi:hypothetical protein